MSKKIYWLKRIVIAFLVIFIVSEGVFFGFNFINKYKIAKKLRINNVTDFFIIGLYESYGPGSDHPLSIKFVISFDAYEKNELNYRKKTFFNYYMCNYTEIIYDKNEVKIFRKMMSDRFRLEVNTIILISLIIVFRKIQLKEKAITK